MSWEAVVEGNHVVVDTREPISNLSGVNFTEGEAIGERCCQKVTALELGEAGATVVSTLFGTGKVRRLTVNLRGFKACAASQEAAQEVLAVVQQLEARVGNKLVVAA